MQKKPFQPGKGKQSPGKKDGHPFGKFLKKESPASWKMDKEDKKDFEDKRGSRARKTSEEPRRDGRPDTRNGKGPGKPQRDTRFKNGEDRDQKRGQKFPGADREQKGDRRSPDRYKKDDSRDGEKKKPNRYANTFGRLDDQELAAHQRKQEQKRKEKNEADEVTFSKELDRWAETTVNREFGKSDVPRASRAGKGAKRIHDDQSRFKSQFDDEKPQEKVYASSGKKEKAEEGPNAETKMMPLNKYIAHCDVCSRRDAVQLIKDGKVQVNGEVITQPGHKVTLADKVILNGTPLVIQKNLVYILMNKPKGFITTTDDPKGRRTVMELVDNFIDERVFPVGRLDRNTTGLLLLTNDGELTQKLSHPKHEVRKVYKATLNKNLSKEDFEKIKQGLVLEDGPAPVDQLEYLESKNEIGLEIHSGKNRIVRRIFESLGYEVEKLDRVMYAGLTKKNVLRGKWRFLTKQEVINLKHIQ